MGYSTQGKLAEKLEIDTSRVSDWERGIHLPEGKLKTRLLGLLKADESLIDIDGLVPLTPPQKVAEMSVADLKSMFREFAEVQGAWDRAEGPSRAVALFFLDPTEARRLKILEALRIPDHLRLVQKRFDDIQAALPSRKSKQ